MGYCITLKKAKFAIKKENVAPALTALKKLGNGSNDLRAAGGSWQGGRQLSRWFSGMNDVKPEKWFSLSEAMGEWLYPIEIDEAGNVTDIDCESEKLGDENIMFETIAPFVEDGSYVHMYGDDGEHWRWVFKNGKMKEVALKMVEEEDEVPTVNNQEYKFDPCKFGFLAPHWMPKVLRYVEAKDAYVKVLCLGNDDSFWYSSCHSALGDDRWFFTSGLYCKGRHTRHTAYAQCITSDKYAKNLLMHLFGTCTNKGTLTVGLERLLAESMPIVED